MNPRTAALMRENAPSERVLDGAPAKCKVLDRRLLYALERDLGGTQGVRAYARSTGGGVNFLEADWVATDQAVYYLSYYVGSVYRWPWEEIAAMSLSRKGRLVPTQIVQLAVHGEVFEMSTARSSAAALIDIWRQKTAGRAR